MASSEIALLVPDFRKKLNLALDAATARGFRMEPMVTLLTPTEQGALWCQGRSPVDAELKVLALVNAKAPYLAECLHKAVPKETNLVTQDVPGNSWFQWGETASVVWIDSQNKVTYSAEWKDRALNNMNGYRVLAEEAEKIGLFVGSCYNMLQLRKEQNPIDAMSFEEIDKEMQRRYRR
jgi:peptidoglycan LD-endopeptidase CwlK